MIFTIGLENTFNVPAEPTDVLDMTMEQILLNLSYKNIQAFNSSSTIQRVPQNREVVGRAEFELTYGNQAWGKIFEVALGKRVRLINKAFRMHQSGLYLINGHLADTLTKTTAEFSITEPEDGIFDGTNCLLIGDEVIDGAVISSGVVSTCNRGSLGTSAKKHEIGDLVYLLQDDTKIIDICGPNIVDERARLTKSLTCWIQRLGEYFRYTGMRVDQVEMNISPEDIIVMAVSFVGADSTNVSPLVPVGIFDSYKMVGGVETYIMSSEKMSIRRLYANFNNTLVKNHFGFNGVYQDLPVMYQNMYGQITWEWTKMQDYLDYINNTKHNLALISVDRSKKPPDNIIVFNNNDMRINTFSPQYTSGLVIPSSAPFYTYGEAQVYLQYGE